MTRKDYDVEHLINIIKGFHQRYPHLKIIMEPGSAFGMADRAACNSSSRCG